MLAAVWWVGTDPIGNAASYWFRRFDTDLDPIGDAIVIGGSEGAGSPPTLIATDEGWVVAWSERTGFGDKAAGMIRVRRLGPDGTPLAAAVQVDEGDLERPPERPALAVVDDGYMVGWRAQTFDQVGVGARAVHVSADLSTLHGPFAIGGPTANRLNLSASGMVVVYQWEEDDDVWFHLGAPDGTPWTAAAPVHDTTTGIQGGGVLVNHPGAEPYTFRIGWEDGPAGAAILWSRSINWLVD